MPTFRHGKNTVFKLDNAGGTLTDVSNVLNNVSFPRETEILETTSFGSSFRTYVVGFQNAMQLFHSSTEQKALLLETSSTQVRLTSLLMRLQEQLERLSLSLLSCRSLAQ